MPQFERNQKVDVAEMLLPSCLMVLQQVMNVFLVEVLVNSRRICQQTLRREVPLAAAQPAINWIRKAFLLAMNDRGRQPFFHGLLVQILSPEAAQFQSRRQ